MKFIHISDLHFHRNKKDNKEAEKVLKAIKANYPKHNLIITGDITDDGHDGQYENAYKALAPFKGKVFIVPGNHDFGAAGNLFSKERALRFDEMLSKRLDQGGTFSGDNTPIVNVLEERSTRVMLIALDTNLETMHPFDFACGEVGEEQLSGLDTILSNPASANMIKILFFHHHPFMHGNPFMELTDAKQLMRTIYSKIDVLLFGHKHTSEKWENYGGIKYVLASDNSPGKDWAREITVEGTDVRMEPVMFNPT
jgi:3',5'-cyclic AMP phosphodiesterase CpdA